MTMANLDRQDLNTLLASYIEEHRKLEKYVHDLTLITIRMGEITPRVDPDIIECGAYVRPKTAKVDLNAAKEKIKVIENKLQYIHELIDKDIAESEDKQL